MNRLNFNKLKNPQVPERWIENALKIPEKRKNPTPRSFFQSVSAVACLVAACLIGVSISNFTNDRQRIMISNSKPTSNTVESSTLFAETDLNTETILKGDENIVTSFSSFDTAYETKENSDHSVESAEKNSLTEMYEENLELFPMQTEPVEHLPPTESVATYPETPSVSSASVATEPTTLQPTADVTVSSSTATGGFNNIESVDVCIGSFPKSLFQTNVYCRLYNSQGELMGDSNLYSSQHIAHYVIESGDRIYAQYLLSKTGLTLPTGKYTYYFYNGNGVDLYQGVVFTD